MECGESRGGSIGQPPVPVAAAVPTLSGLRDIWPALHLVPPASQLLRGQLSSQMRRHSPAAAGVLCWAPGARLPFPTRPFSGACPITMWGIQPAGSSLLESRPWGQRTLDAQPRQKPGALCALYCFPDCINPSPLPPLPSSLCCVCRPGSNSTHGHRRRSEVGSEHRSAQGRAPEAFQVGKWLALMAKVHERIRVA